MRILVVEDSPTIRMAIEQMITQIGHTALLVSSGEEALQLTGESEFDMVLMDIEMPGLDGFETTTLMREALEHWIPIIFISGHEADDQVLAGIKAGGDDYMIKPFSPIFLEAKIISMKRISEMNQRLDALNNHLADLSEKDELTQLSNRRAFKEKAKQVLHLSQRHRKPVSVLMLDVDHFKAYNDFYGHMEGDICLKGVAEALRETVHRSSDIVARYGGEEFVVLLTDTDVYQARLVALKILENLQSKNIPHEKSLTSDRVTISIGVASTSVSDQYDLNRLTDLADQQLYYAKESGRNQVHAQKDKSQKTILVASTNSDNRSALSNAMQSYGNIVTADSYQERSLLAKEIQPDLSIYDGTCDSIGEMEALKDLQLSTLLVEDKYGHLLGRVEAIKSKSAAQIEGLLVSYLR